MPSAVIRSTTCDGTSVGGIFGSGGGGACATATVAIIMETTVSAALAISLPGCFLRISSSFFCAQEGYSLHTEFSRKCDSYPHDARSQVPLLMGLSLPISRCAGHRGWAKMWD